MKNFFFYLSIIILFTINFSNTLFSQSREEKYKILSTYLEGLVKHSGNEIFIAKEKINNNTTIDVLKKDWIFVLNSNGKWVHDRLFFNKESWQKMEKKYKNGCLSGKLNWCNNDFWSKENFAYNKVIFESMNTDKGIESVFKKYNNLHIMVYGFSDPIYYQNKKYIIFTVNISGFNSYEYYIVVMRKKNKKWIITHEGRDPDYIN